ncbi:MAG: YidC/Oxa1 family membrane protein insertase [Patescibacteria group bacterium]
MIQLYHVIFYQPIFNALIWLYNVIPGHDIGAAIILLTLLVRVLIFPLTLGSLRSQRALQALQPQMNALREQYKNEKEKLAKATMQLYAKEKVNPMSSCLPLIFQLPIFIALYQALIAGLNGKELDTLYSFIAHPEAIGTIAFGFVDLAKANIWIALLAGATQFWQAKSLTHTQQPKAAGAKDEAMLSMMNKQMLYMMPAMTVFIGAGLPGGLSLYWLVSNIFTVLQQKMFLKPTTEKVAQISQKGA